MKYCIMQARAKFYFDTDYLVRIQAVNGFIDGTSINMIEIYSWNYDSNADETYKETYFKMEFHGTVTVTVHKNITFIEPWSDSDVLNIKREMIKAGIDVGDKP